MEANSVSNLLHIAAARIVRRVKNADASDGLSPARMSVLSVLVREGPQSLGELARIEQVRAPTMTNIVRGLEEEGHVARRSNQADGRVVLIRSTAKGRRRLKRGLKNRETMVLGLLRDLSPRELETVERAARILDSRLTGFRQR